MKQNVLLLLLMSIFSIYSCKNNSTKVEPNNTDTTHFFSIANFFTSEIKTLETTPYPIYQIISRPNGTKDSSAIDKTLFALLAKQFIACDISDSVQKQAYKEVAFNDNSTKSITLNYTTSKKDLPIQSIDVLFDEETNHVRRVFIRKILSNKDSSTTVLYSWKANMSFTITKSVIKKDGTKYTEQQYVNWNDGN
jgi:membrane-bound inhibitor of C-type lysozyme